MMFRSHQSSLVNTTSKSKANAAEKRTHTETMAEEDENVNDVTIQPKPKKMKLNNDNNDPIAPFVLLPAEVLEQIFIKVDDFGLLNLANTCTRFESIALAVAPKRYADRYFLITSDRFSCDREIYEAMFNRFGSCINAIEVRHIKNIDAKHWMTKMLRPHVSRITALTLHNSNLGRGNLFSPILHQITHLKIRNEHSYTDCNIDLFKCRKLVRLDVQRFSNRALEQIVRNNPGLQSIFSDGMDVKLFQENSISDHLDQITEVGNLDLRTATAIRPDSMDRIAHTLRNLESLELQVHSQANEPLQRLGIGCKRIKCLKLKNDWVYHRHWDDAMIDAVRSFQQIEYLHLSGDRDEIGKIELAVKCLPNLRHLHFEVLNFGFAFDADFPFAGILSLLRECPSLQTINVLVKDVHLEFMSTQFFNDFLDTITVTAKSNARIEIEKHGKIIATMNRYGIVCRKKLMHWIGCDNISESSDTHLLDLAKQLIKSNVEGERSQENLLDRVFTYLDATSLFLFAETSSQSKQMVENYIKEHSKQNGLFTITNEFYAFDHYYGLHEMFAPHVTNLKVYNFERLQQWNYTGCFLERFTLLTKVSIYDKVITEWHFPRWLRHLILDGPEFIDFSELYKIYILCSFKGIHTMELRNASSFNDFEYEKKDFHGVFVDWQLETFIFNYRGETQFKHLKEMFEGSGTKLVPTFRNSNHF